MSIIRYVITRYFSQFVDFLFTLMEKYFDVYKDFFVLEGPIHLFLFSAACPFLAVGNPVNESSY